MAKPITNRVKTGKTPVIRKDLEGGVIAEANNDGSIYVDKSVKKGSPLEKEAIAHEKVHLNQMERGDLNYDDDNVYWKGKSYPRSTMNEGAKKLPWEKEAYNKTEHMKTKSKKKSPAEMSDADLVANNKQTHKKFQNYSTPLSMQSNPITAKTRSTTSPLHKNGGGGGGTTATKEYKGNIQDGGSGTFRVVTKQDIAQSFSKGGSIPGAQRYNKLASDEGAYMAGIRKKFPYTTAADLADKKYISQSKISEMDSKFPAAEEPKDKGTSTTKSREASFTPDKVVTPGKPGDKGKYNMPHLEARNLRLSSGEKRRGLRKNIRASTREYYRGTRTKKKDREIINPETGEPMGLKERMKYMGRALPSYVNPSKKRFDEKVATRSTIGGDAPANPGLKTYDSSGVELDGSYDGKVAKLKKLVKGTKAANLYDATDISSAFKMGGYGLKKNK
tara:strand:- start:1088 stop:2425 length:1338 start_codon:yes stop_codon:yes gene_type:complete